MLMESAKCLSSQNNLWRCVLTQMSGLEYFIPQLLTL